MIQWIENPQQQTRYHAEGQAEKRHQDNEADHERQHQRDKSLEALVVRKKRPLRAQLAPGRRLGHDIVGEVRDPRNNGAAVVTAQTISSSVVNTSGQKRR